jgi:hypothetical protein
MRRRKISKYLMIAGSYMFPLSILMFITGISMFSATGDFSQFIIELAGFCFAFWMPTFILGILLVIIGLIFKKLNF